MVTKAGKPRIHAGFPCQPMCDQKCDQGCDRRAKTRWAGGRLFSGGKTESVTGRGHRGVTNVKKERWLQTEPTLS